jgi:hypothetical protein
MIKNMIKAILTFAIIASSNINKVEAASPSSDFCIVNTVNLGAMQTGYYLYCDGDMKLRKIGKRRAIPEISQYMRNHGYKKLATITGRLIFVHNQVYQADIEKSCLMKKQPIMKGWGPWEKLSHYNYTFSCTDGSRTTLNRPTRGQLNQYISGQALSLSADFIVDFEMPPGQEDSKLYLYQVRVL